MTGVFIENWTRDDLEDVFAWARVGKNNCMIGVNTEVTEIPRLVRMLKPGDVCPICGRTIKTTDLDALELLSCYARVFELLNKGVRPGDCQEGNHERH